MGDSHILDKNKLVIVNSVSGIAYRFVALVLGIIFRRIFIQNMGQELSGLTGMYSNIIDMLKLTLAGVGLSALHKLYVCNANNDTEKRENIYFFAKKFYLIVSVIIFLLGCFFSLFIDKLIYNNTYSIEFLRIVFMAQVLSNSIPLLFSFESIAIRSYEEQYIGNIVNCIVDIASYVAQILVIVLTKNYFLYLILVIARFTLQSVLIAKITSTRHPVAKLNKKFSVKEMLGEFSDLKDTLAGQVANFVFLATDNIIISKFFGLVSVNLYCNYMIIINAVITFFDEINSSIQSRIGVKFANNCEVDSKYSYIKKNYVYQQLVLSIAIAGVILFVDEFITIWLGREFLLSRDLTILFIINFVIYELNMPLRSLALSTGLFALEKKTSIMGALLNIVTSILLSKTIGLKGVIIGSIVGNLTMLLMRVSTIVYKQMLNKMRTFAILFLRLLLIMFIIIIICEIINIHIINVNVFVRWLLKVIIVIAVPFGVNYIFFVSDINNLMLRLKK